MEFSKEIFSSVKALNDPSLIADEDFEKLITEISCSIANPEDENTSSGSSSTTWVLINSLLHCIFVECAKLSTEASELNDFLTTASLSEMRSSCVCKAYQENKERIRRILLRTTLQRRKVVDVEWSLEHVVKNSYTGKVSEPMYRVNFITKEADGGTGNLEMYCTSVEMNDLVSKFQEAHKHIENMTGS